MSGWIKFEKDLATDPRVLRMAKRVECLKWWPSNGIALHPVTVVLGALARLWIHADSHARDDDSLDMSPAELDELLGVPGLCALMPADWLTIIDEHTVELPGFQAHNGVEAKSRAVTAKRVERHRKRSKRETVTGRNAAPLPDQTRPDQTRPSRKSAHESGTNANGKAGGDIAPTTGGGALAYSTGLTQLPADDTSTPGMAWLDVGCDVQAMTAWLDHLEALTPPKRLAPHTRIQTAKLLTGMGDAAAQRRAVATASANGWRNLRHTDGASTGLPGGRKTMAERLAALGPDDDGELEDTGATA